MQMDVFRRYWKRERPTFSTLFLNSTAHFQHLHWREMEPHLFQVQPTAAELADTSWRLYSGISRWTSCSRTC